MQHGKNIYLNQLKSAVNEVRLMLLLAQIVVIVTNSSSSCSASELLKGEIEREDAQTGLRTGNSNGPAIGGGGDSLRIERVIPVAPSRFGSVRGSTGMAQGSPRQGLIDTSAFSRPLVGNARREMGMIGANGSTGTNLGLASPAQFGNIPANKFELGADRSSQELVLAWERWHRQLSAAIYTRWSERVDRPGKAVVRLTISKDRNIQAVMVRSSGNNEFDSNLLAAILSLNGNPGLTFPSQSQRQQVTLESDYIAGTNIDPGYSWVRNDYERVDY